MNINIKQSTPSPTGSRARRRVKMLPVSLMAGGLIASVMTMQTASAATLSESAVQQYASRMQQAANSKNISQVSNLVSDDALISMSRKGKTTSLDKSAYLKLLQDSWAKTDNYRYDISINNIVVSGDQAKADVRTVETWRENGKNTTLTTNSRATLTAGNGNALLLRAVSQVSID